MDRGGESKGAPAAWISQLRGWGLTALRVVVGIVFVAHGGQKLFGSGFTGFAGSLEGQGVPLPLLFATLVILTEVVGGAALIVGLFTRLFAVPLAINMLVAGLLVHSSNGFFSINGGFEYTLVLMVACVALVLSGPGEAALDKVLAARSNKTLAPLLRWPGNCPNNAPCKGSPVFPLPLEGFLSMRAQTLP